MDDLQIVRLLLIFAKTISYHETCVAKLCQSCLDCDGDRDRQRQLLLHIKNVAKCRRSMEKFTRQLSCLEGIDTAETDDIVEADAKTVIFQFKESNGINTLEGGKQNPAGHLTSPPAVE